MKTRTKTVLFFAFLIAVAACSRLPEPEQPAPPELKPAASIQDLMKDIVEPSADALWESVSTELTANGIEEKQPRTELEWAAVRRYATTLQEAANLLLIDGRPVAHIGKVTEDAHVEGVSSPQQVKLAIDANRPGFNASALALQDASTDAVKAIDAKDPARLLAAGAELDQACERCHSVYWYPNAKQPPASWPAPLKAD